MTFTIEEFYEDFRNQLETKYASRSGFHRNMFLGTVIEEMQAAGEAHDYELCSLNVKNRIRADAYHIDLINGTVDLFYADCRSRPRLELLSESSSSRAFKSLRRVVQAGREGGLHRQLDETTPGYRLARGLYDHRDAIKRARLFFASERQLGPRQKRAKSYNLQGVHAIESVWDISRLYRRTISKSGREPLEIDLMEMFRKGLHCLQPNLGTNAFPAYLAVVSGDILATLYREYDQKLLEQNVRCFLQARGIVNKGIRRTILENGQHFFAYNNGITATAKKVITESSSFGTQITRITDFQIVNGGQTTVSLYQASIQNNNPDLSQVFVQMKLTVIGDDDEEISAKISQYANTQNKVNAADLQSNHPFHQHMEKLSRIVWAPAAGGSPHKTKWYYERLRGQYQSDLMKATAAKTSAEFRAQYPRAQKFTKTDLGRVENMWDAEPKWVNLGAQKNFVQFIDRVDKEWKHDDKSFDAAYYKRAIARLLVFKATEKLVSAQEWYEGGYRANVVAYTIALASHLAKNRSMALRYGQVWDCQAVSESLLDGLAELARHAFNALHSDDRAVQNVSEWAKRAALWERLKVSVGARQLHLSDAYWDNFEPVAKPDRV